MFKDTSEPAPPDDPSQVPVEQSRWTVGTRRHPGGALLPPCHLPVGPQWGDDYPLIEPGTPSEVSAEALRELSGQEAAAWTPFGKPLRRREPRYEVTDDRVWIQWWSAGEFNGLSARLVNVSRHGALIVTACRLREHQALRISMEDPEQPSGVNAVVLGGVEGANGLNKIRLGFLTPCPDAFFVAVANGFEAWLGGSRVGV